MSSGKRMTVLGRDSQTGGTADNMNVKEQQREVQHSLHILFTCYHC